MEAAVGRLEGVVTEEEEEEDEAPPDLACNKKGHIDGVSKNVD